jgi:hypothetical protein
MKDGYKDENLSPHVRAGCEELEERLAVILHMIQKINEGEDVFK